MEAGGHLQEEVVVTTCRPSKVPAEQVSTAEEHM